VLLKQHKFVIGGHSSANPLTACACFIHQYCNLLKLKRYNFATRSA